jgi:hypothetical protein
VPFDDLERAEELCAALRRLARRRPAVARLIEFWIAETLEPSRLFLLVPSFLEELDHLLRPDFAFLGRQINAASATASDRAPIGAFRVAPFGFLASLRHRSGGVG